MHVCTVVGRGSIARARVMADTLREHHPDASLTVLVADAATGETAGLADADVLDAASVLGDSYGLLAAANPPGALSMAVLAYLARQLLDAGERSIVYLAPGVRVLGPLDELCAASDKDEVVLVARPHARRAVAEPTRAGGEVFSRSVLALRSGPSVEALLAAWPRYFAIDADEGSGAVNAWLDSISALVERLGVLRHPGYGLDPWSLADLSMSPVAATADGAVSGPGGAGSLLVGGLPARLIDLGGIDPADPPSWFDGPRRARLSDAPALVEVVESHTADLRDAGLASAQEEEIPYTRLDDGLHLTDTVRSLTLKAILEGELTRSPFTEAGRTELYVYLNRIDGRGRAAGLTRLHMAIREGRTDLREAYRHIDGPDGVGFAGWLCVHGGEQEGLVDELLPPAPELAYRDADAHLQAGELRWGVNVAGFFTAELGVGEAARLLIAGLDAQDTPALPIQGELMPPSRREVEFDYVGPDEAAYPINILCINGDGIPVFAREAGRSFFADRYTIALWFWEAGEPPASWSPAYALIDEVWVASRHIYEEIAPTSPVPVVQIALPVLEPDLRPLSRTELGLPAEGFLFLYVHDYNSVAVRKNPLGVVEAFKRAFPPGTGAKLVIKSINAATHLDQHERVVLAAAQHADVTLIDAYVAAREKNAMIAACDCYVSLHRSEGFGITVAEAMLLAKPVIATRYGGTMEFTNDENSYLVRWDPVRVGDHAFPYSSEAMWADPDLDHAASLMRSVLAEREQARRRGELARRTILERHSPVVAGAAMKRRLAGVYERLRENGVRSLNLAHLPPAAKDEGVDALLAGAPAIRWGSGRRARLRRRVLLPLESWSRAYADHQHLIDAATQGALARIDADARDLARSLHEQQNAHHAQTMAALRRLEAEIAALRDDGEGPSDALGRT